MKLGLLILVLASATSLPLYAQKKGTENKITSGVAKKLSEVMGGVNLEEESTLDLDDLATSVQFALMEIDPDAISSQNSKVLDLKAREEEIADQIEKLSRNEQVPLTEDDMYGPAEAISEEDLEMERHNLAAQRLRIAELQRAKEMRAKKVQAINDAKTMTKLSHALLSTLEDMPPLEELTSENMEVKTEFPARLARALFRTGDFVGSLKHHLLVPESERTHSDFYEIARCYEEMNQPEKALPIAQELLKRTTATDEFWHSRAKTLEKLLKTLLGIGEDPENGKDN